MAEDQKSDAPATKVSEEVEAKQAEVPLETKVALPKVPFEPVEAPPAEAPEQKPVAVPVETKVALPKVPFEPAEAPPAEPLEEKPAPAAAKVSEQVEAKLPEVPIEKKQKKATVAKKAKAKARIGHRLPGKLEDPPITIALVAMPTELSPTQNSVTLTPMVPGVTFGDPRGVTAQCAVAGATATASFSRVSDTELRGTIDVRLPAGVAATGVTITAPVNVTTVLGSVPGQGTATVVYSSAMVPVTPPSAVDVRPALTAALDGATLTVRSPNDGLLTRVPLVPLSAFVALPSVGPLTTSSVPLPLSIGGVPTVVNVDFTFTWTVDGVPALPIQRPDGSALAAGATDAPQVTVRPIPPVVPVPAAGASPAGAATARIACHLEAHAVGTDVRVTRDLAAERAIALPLPRVLALYRAPDMGPHYPSWRQRNVDAARNSGVVVFGAPAELAPPAPPLSALLPSVPVPSPFSTLGGLGARLFEIAGPVPTLLGTAGLAALPSPADTPAALAPVVDPLRRLAEAIALLTGSFAGLVALNPGHGTYARLDQEALVQDLSTVHFIDGEGFGTLAVHVQDEAEAAILLGPTGATADLFVLGQLRTEASGVFFHDSGTARLATGTNGFVAVVPDLAIVGPMNGDTSFGWLPQTGATTYDAAHARPPDDRFGSITVTNQIDEDRSGGSDPPDAMTTDTENQRRKNTPARTISSLRIN